MFRLEHYAIDPEVKRLREENARLKYQLAHPVVAVQVLKVPMEMVFRIGVDKAATKAIKISAYKEIAEALKNRADKRTPYVFVFKTEIDDVARVLEKRLMQCNE